MKKYEQNAGTYGAFRSKKNRNERSMLTARKKETVFYVCVVTLPIVQFLIFYVYANINSFTLSLKNWTAAEGFTWAGITNYKNMWLELTTPNTNLNVGMINAIKVYLLGWIIKPLQLLFPFYVYKKMPCHGFFKIMLFLPQILSTTCVALIYKYVVDQVIPEISFLYFDKRMMGMLSDPNSTFWAAWVFGVVEGLGGTILIYTSAMSRIPETLVEYAKIEGCTGLKEFTKITFPLILPTFSVYLLLGFTSIFSATLNLYTFFGSGAPIQTVGYYTYVMVVDSSGYTNYPKAAAIGMFFTIILVPLTIVMRNILNRLTPKVEY
ncbi:MAG: sugar ABC transporter permease [Clostridia bacterium]|nr:sugar ABC transporter permease [Clostridia bacterium]